MKYKQLSQEQRHTISRVLNKVISQRFNTNAIRVHKSTASCEIKQNKSKWLNRANIEWIYDQEA